MPQVRFKVTIGDGRVTMPLVCEIRGNTAVDVVAQVKQFLQHLGAQDQPVKVSTIDTQEVT